MLFLKQSNDMNIAKNVWDSLNETILFGKHNSLPNIPENFIWVAFQISKLQTNKGCKKQNKHPVYLSTLGLSKQIRTIVSQNSCLTVNQ